jgi:hypothetical protein
MRERIIVDKLNPRCELVWRYAGEVIDRGEGWLILDAFFDRDDTRVAGITLQRGDHFVESYYSDRWYNIFEIHSRDGDVLKGWYCNITKPAVILADRIEYVDLYLDLWVSPDGRQSVLDEDEFQAADLDEATRLAALGALEELRESFKTKQPPH